LVVRWSGTRPVRNAKLK
jgi:hypothetical protein